MMKDKKIFTVAQIREADAYTINCGSISSVNLMERAVAACVQWIGTHTGFARRFVIVCGQGNNGGDGLAIARMLSQIQEVKGVEVYILRLSERSTPDFSENFRRLQQCAGVTIYELLPDTAFRLKQPADILIDAIIGSGLSAPVSGWLKEVITTINALNMPVISIDIPSGMFADIPLSKDATVIRAEQVLSFQFPKLSFMFPESGAFMEAFHVLPIGIEETYIIQTPTPWYYITEDAVLASLKKRCKFTHKGDFGHALLIAGSYGKMGAAVLAARACLRAGTGLLTVHVPQKGVAVLQTAFPEAMVSVDEGQEIISSLPNNLLNYDGVGVGSGMGTQPFTREALRSLLEHIGATPLVLDADALNILALEPALLKFLPENTILTPHPKEFERLSGQAYTDSLSRLQAAQAFAAQYKVIVLLKGAYTAVCVPDGTVFFNTTGNPGMATAGSGDVLTGVITSLLAQGYTPLDAAIISVCLHGRAGDKAAVQRGQTALIASDIIESL
ncbi:MAG: NAD(P)H-hydrate dehydratase [Prevotellaceae bacterium]|jgi:NAD(P)H-hydrate epimerase|nr:NAD(P)H-hydrate dehydratase [Prevotellaceae bacterium]